MKFEKGKSGNPKGREKGSKNKKTLVIEAGVKEGLNGIAKAVGEYVEGGGRFSLAGDLASEELTAKDRLTIMERYAQYVVPKQQSTSVDLSAQLEVNRTLHDTLKELSQEEDS